jgi:lysophospholipid hydrolase
VILTRFSRVTFNAAHNYLGLTTEVLRTEKAINDIACHPLPSSFYEGGGLRHLRQRFDGISTSELETDRDSDYFSYPASKTSSRNSSSSSLAFQVPDIKSAPKGKPDALPQGDKRSSVTPFKGAAARQQVHAGDLHSSTTQNESMRPQARSRSSIYTPYVPPNSPRRNVLGAQRLNTVDFDLRDEVMSCIAKSIGLLQPPLSGEESVEASPAFLPSDAGRTRPNSQAFGSSFGSLTLLGMGDDASSEITASSTGVGDGNLSGLDNEVEILFFPTGSILAKAGEMNTGES